jgi:hypothetical protein
MSGKDFLVWLFARKTKAGSKYLYGDEAAFQRLIRVGQVAICATGKLAESPRWSKYTASEHHDTGAAQTNYFEGYIGETDQGRKVHIAVDDHGHLLFVRDIDGTVLFDRSRGDTPPPGWN